MLPIFVTFNNSCTKNFAHKIMNGSSLNFYHLQYFSKTCHFHWMQTSSYIKRDTDAVNNAQRNDLHIIIVIISWNMNGDNVCKLAGIYLMQMSFCWKSLNPFDPKELNAKQFTVGFEHATNIRKNKIKLSTENSNERSLMWKSIEHVCNLKTFICP